MLRYEKRYWPLAAGLAGLAGFVDAIGFIKLGGYFVSFMSGNTTRFAVGVAHSLAVATISGQLIASFLIGVVLGTVIAAKTGNYRKSAVLTFVALLLGASALLDRATSGLVPALLLALAMGAENAVFQRDGEVSIGVTYMTGTLVKFGQHVAGALMGGPRWTWLPYCLLWSSLTTGAILGALAYPMLGGMAIGLAATAAAVMAIYAYAIRRQAR